MKCYLNQEVAQKMHYYVQSVDAEISGICKSEIRDGDIYIVDILIRKQVCSGARTTIDEADDMKGAYEMTKAGEDLAKWNVWWHSHDKMGVFWSSTDTDTIKSLCSGGSFFISIVTNKAGKFKTRLDAFPKDVSPFNIQSHVLAKDDIETIILPAMVDEARKKELEDHLDEQSKICDAQIADVENEVKDAITELEKYRADKVKEIEDKYYEDFGDFENELELMSENVVLEDLELKEKIATEVAEKVSLSMPVLYQKKSKGFKQQDFDFSKGWNKDSQCPKDNAPSTKWNKFKAMSDEELATYIADKYRDCDDDRFSEIGSFDLFDAVNSLEEAEEEMEIRNLNSEIGYRI